jgi:hypothetical protein
MKFLAALVLTALLSFIGGLYLPWWSIAFIAFLVALLVHQRAFPAFLAGFLALFLLWGGLAWWIDLQNQHILSKRIAAVLPLGGSSMVLVLVTSFIGGLVAGMGAVTGSFLRSKPKTK